MSMRERLRGRKLPEETLWLRVDFGPESQTAEQELADARRELNLARIRDRQDEVERHHAEVDAALERFNAFHEQLTLRASPPAEVEALIAAHPPTEDQAKSDEPWAESFKPALIAATVVGDETEEDWAEWLATGPCTTGEKRALFAACMQVNDRTSDLRVGKG